MHKFKTDQQNLPSIGELLKLLIVELITAYSNTNKKVKKLAEEIFRSVFTLVMHMSALSQLFQMLLVGFASNKIQIQSATIRALLLLLKINYSVKDKEPSAVQVHEAGFQEFLRKVTKIIVLFMKDHQSGNELHRSVLKYIKTIVSFLTPQILKGELSEQMFMGIFGIQNDKKTFNKHNMLIKKILSKFVKKLGLVYVKSITPAQHHKLISYIERDRRKRLNKQKRFKLMALLGKEDKPKASASGDAEMKSDNSDSSGNDDNE